ncbi:MAG: helix-turn-helix domain-containing protein [Alkalibacterium sp.]|nr:helix-turn-helix domain-containing protein [Alkalibacterium sp.]
MLVGIKGKLTLNPDQQVQVLQNIGNARFVWNQFLKYVERALHKQSFYADVERV